jgi:hypothetical protein
MKEKQKKIESLTVVVIFIHMRVCFDISEMKNPKFSPFS